MVAILMLVYHVILCKFILYLKSQFWKNDRCEPVLTTLCKVLCRHTHISLKSSGSRNSSAAKKDRLEKVRFNWKGSEIYRFCISLAQIFFRQPTMVADILRDFVPPSKNFLATLLVIIQTTFLLQDNDTLLFLHLVLLIELFVFHSSN